MSDSIISKSLKTLLKDGVPESAFLVWEVPNSPFYVQVALGDDSLLSFNINGVSGKVPPDEPRAVFSPKQLADITALGWVASSDDDEEDTGDSRYSFLDDIETDESTDVMSEHDFFLHVRIDSREDFDRSVTLVRTTFAKIFGIEEGRDVDAKLSLD